VHYYKYWQALLLVAIFEKQNDRRNTIVWAIYIEVRWRIWLPEQRKESNAVLQLIHLQVMNNALFFCKPP
jgi:CRISPR/Cas system-associated endonuclease Cas3-HD